ncbi:MAG: penicillin-binding protein 2 [Parcubacteria group bacterium]|nr:penicillin-binding protein 2 [Parcubacteria group bacterium]|tara:strand:- start:10590 stop:12545 length:1956 start_codon:yes stop_codon:yes gene_type:complete
MRPRAGSNPFAINDNQRFGNYSGRSKLKGKWHEVESFSDTKSNIRDNSLGLLLNNKVINIWLAVLLAGILVLVIRTAFLQIVMGDHFSAIAEGNRVRVRDIKAARGVIYDRHQNLLVKNVPGFFLAFVPVDLSSDAQKRLEIAEELSKISLISTEEITELMESQSPYSYQPVIVGDVLTQDQAILTEIVTGNYSGVILKTDNTRFYLPSGDNPSFSHILGYLGKLNEDKLESYLSQGYSFNDNIGKAGIEFSYENVLKGVNGREQVEVDATGEAKEVIAQEKPIAGKNLVLTIDAELQKQAELSLRRSIGAYDKKRGVAIVMNPNSGEVLAMVNWPSFDNNLFSRGISGDEFSELINDPNQPLFSRAISGEYPSGSTFKMIVAAAALEENIVTPAKSFLSTGGLGIKSWFFPDWKAGGHGWTNVVKALAESVNTYFYIIGGGLEEEFDGLGVANIKRYAEKFNLNEPLGIDLPGEASGFLPTIAWKESVKQESWYIGDTYHLAIGQGDILVTPLQMAVWTSAFANDGILYKPYLVKEILDKDNNVVTEIDPQIIDQNFIRPENISTVNRGLRQAVLSGSAQGLFGLPITVAAKTGTAQWSSTKEPHAWLTAFAPYDDPQIVVTVLVEEGIGGTTTALPVVRDIVNWWAENR